MALAPHPPLFRAGPAGVSGLNRPEGRPDLTTETNGAGTGTGTASGSFRELLLDKLKTTGPVTFRDFMATVLYHPEFGYYNRERPVVGRGGDFFTCPSHSPFFGVALAEYVRRIWVQMGCPAEFTVLEMGGGEGHLAESLLGKLAASAGAGGPTGPNVKYIIV